MGTTAGLVTAAEFERMANPTSGARHELRHGEVVEVPPPKNIVEVLLPSNTASEMFDRERTCLEGGCQEFWVIDPDRRQVRVSTPDRAPRTYGVGEAVPVFDKSIQLNDIFGS